MLRMFIGGNTGLLNSIVSKAITKCLKKNYGCKSAKASSEDFVIYQLDNNRLLIHLNGNLEIDKDELLNLINNKLKESE